MQVLEDTSISDGDLVEDQDPKAPAQGEIFCESALYPFELQPFEDDPLLAYGASADPDTLYYHEAMKEPDAPEFRKAMEKELLGQWDNGNFSLKKRSEVPQGKSILPGVWAFKRKREVLTGKVSKHKARWTLDGSKQKFGIDFNKTYSPTANWASIRLLLALSLINNWETRQIDFVQAFPQCKISHEQYVELPKGIDIEGIDPALWVFQLHNNVYGGKDAGRQWYLYLRGKLESIGFQVSRFDECVFFRGRVMYVLYTDDSILAGPDGAELDEIIERMREAQLDLTVEGTLSDFLGVNISRMDDGKYVLTQPRLIDSVIQEVIPQGLPVSLKDIPMASSRLLSRHLDSPDAHELNMRRVIGKLNFIANSTRADVAYATHQIARFVSKPKQEHVKAVEWLTKYLVQTKDEGYIIDPDSSKGLQVYVDADFAGNWDPRLAGEDIDTARSRHGYIIMYAGVPIIWKSALQTECALSTTEAELIGLSVSLRTAIPLLNMLNEMKDLGFPISAASPQVHCELFEDNNGALAIAKFPKMRPRTKHINIKYFHFLEYTSREDSLITFHKIDTEDQPADMLTKPLASDTLAKHRLFTQGW